jgi:hypothetical protein
MFSRNQRYKPTQSEIDAQSDDTSIAQTHYSEIPEERLLPGSYYRGNNQDRETSNSFINNSTNENNIHLFNLFKSQINFINFYFKLSLILISLFSNFLPIEKITEFYTNNQT